MSDVYFKFRRSNVVVDSFVDLDYIGDLDKRRSMTSCVFSLDDIAIS